MTRVAAKKFLNDAGVDTIILGVKAFACIGNTPPHDHPHIYLEMGEDNEILCPYCATRFRFDRFLRANQTNPQGCFFGES